MKITWYGNASILLEAAGESILFDPFLEMKGGEHCVSVEEYVKYPNICVTHGHFDHLASLPEILSRSDPTVYCTEQAEKNLSRLYKGEANLKRIAPGDVFSVGGIKVSVLSGKHIRFDGKLVFKTAFNRRIFRYFPNLLRMGKNLRKFPAKKETVVYFAEAEGKSVLVMGSLGLNGEQEYPQGADVFVCPFQGNTHVAEKAEEIIGRLRPKSVLLDHFDDAFPPLSETIEVSRFCAEATGRLGIGIIAPEFKKALEF